MSRTAAGEGYERRVVCFIDILGFRQIICHTVDASGNPDREAVERLKRTFAVIRDHLGLGSTDVSEHGTQATQFSDSIVLSFPYSLESGVWDTLLSILHLLVDLADREVLCRGGVGLGWVLHTADTLFGPALVEAYELESRAAQYPRVILDDTILDLARKYRAGHHTAADEEAYVKEVVRKDSDGMWYVDYIGAAYGELNDPEGDYSVYLAKLRSLASAGLSVSDPGVRIKYAWLRERYNEALASCKRTAAEGRFRDADVRGAYEALELL